MVSMNSSWSKNNRRELKRSAGRFLAIFAIIALGVGFFAGLKCARPAMVNIGSEYVNQSNFYDYQLISTLGLTEEDSVYFSALEGVAAAEGSVSADLLTVFREDQVVFKTHQLLEQQNQITLVAGRMPEAPNECLGDDLYFSETDLGTVLTVENDEDESPFSQDSYTLVGLCHTAQYLNIQRGTTNLANGTVAAFLYLPKEAYDSEVYTELYLRLNTDNPAFTDAYETEIAQWKETIKTHLQQRMDLRSEEVIVEAQAKLDDAKAEYEEGLRDYNDAKEETTQELNNAKEELDTAATDLADARRTLEEGEAELIKLQNDPMSNADYAAARRELDNGWADWNTANEEYQSALTEFNEALPAAEKEIADGWEDVEEAENALAGPQAELYGARSQLKTARSQMVLARIQLDRDWDAYYAALEADPSQEEALSEEYARLQQEEATYAENMAQIEAQSAAVEAGIAELRPTALQVEEAKKQLTNAEAELNNAKNDLAKAKTQLDQAKADLESGGIELERSFQSSLTEARADLDTGWADLAAAEADYAQGLLDYEEGTQEAEREFAKAEEDLADALVQLEDAQQLLNEMKSPACYVLDRFSNNGYTAFDSDTAIINDIARIFPIFFFLVAALVCSSTMTRMVEEHRTENGTLKALGYTDWQIMWRYASYAGSAALLGCAAGFFSGSWLFPYVIWHAYKMLYHFGEIQLLLDWKLCITALFFSLLCSVGAACAAAWSEMRQMPAQLMRPKAPKAGKHILLDRITPLWQHMSFLHKVAARNIFRYKKRLFMMILGVSGCIALLIAALGLRDSISNVAEDQFSRITLYDYSITFSTHQTPQEQQTFSERFQEELTGLVFVSSKSMDAQRPDGSGSEIVTVVATNDAGLLDMVKLRNGDTELGMLPDDGVFVSRRLAELTDTAIGGTITLQVDNSHLYEVSVAGIFDNYVQHSIYMSDNAYRQFFEREPEYSVAYAETDLINLHQIAAVLQDGEDVVSVSLTSDFRDMISDTLRSLDAVIIVVVFCAAALSFVVSYNLCNINITERVREVATIKVLGFYEKETYAYIFRETAAVTCIGVLVGIPLGIWLHRFILAEIEVGLVSFHVQIFPISFVFSILFTFLVIILVEFLLHPKIDRINMAESLKSVE